MLFLCGVHSRSESQCCQVAWTCLVVGACSDAWFGSSLVFLLRLLCETVGGLNFHGISLEGSCKGQDDSSQEEEEGNQERKRERAGLYPEPYTCERLSSVRGGYRELTGSCAALKFDFTNPQV